MRGMMHHFTDPVKQNRADFFGEYTEMSMGNKHRVFYEFRAVWLVFLNPKMENTMCIDL
jgi:hypothetical protein